MNLRIPAMLLALALAAPAAAEEPSAVRTLVVDGAHSSVSFRIRHLLSRVEGRFTAFAGTLTGDPSKPEGAKVSFTIRAASIDTAIADRDKHLRSPDFFDVEKYPEITFRSTAIRPKGGGLYDVEGDFTLHGVTRRIVLPVAFLGSMKDPWGNEKFAFSLETRLDRKDYGIVWNKVLDQGGTVLGDTVDITIELEMAPQKAS
ncbi:MAG: YceI family protein [Acidobacteriota bacterium]